VIAPVAISLENMLTRAAYIADHLGLTSLSALMYYFLFRISTRYIFITRELVLNNIIKGIAALSAWADVTTCRRVKGHKIAPTCRS
jgi:hypothetical protein